MSRKQIKAEIETLERKRQYLSQKLSIVRTESHLDYIDGMLRIVEIRIGRLRKALVTS